MVLAQNELEKDKERNVMNTQAESKQSVSSEDLSAQNAADINDLSLQEELATEIKGGLKIKLPDVLVSSWQTSASDGSGLP